MTETLYTFSTNTAIVDKPVKIDDHYYCNGKKVNLGYGWSNCELPLNEIYLLLTELGHPLAPAVEDSHRIESNFISHQIALVDIDYGMTLNQLPTFTFYQQHGSGFYTTKRHTDEEQRFRLIYALERPITNISDMRHLYIGLHQIHSYADTSCKDAVRLFYGNPTPLHRELTDRILDNETIDVLIEIGKVLHIPTSVPAPTVSSTSFKKSSEQEVYTDLYKLKQHYPSLDNQQRLYVKSATTNALSNEQAAVQMCNLFWPDTPDRSEPWSKPRVLARISMGSVIEMIRRYDPSYKKSKVESKLELIDRLTQKSNSFRRLEHGRS